MTDTTIPTSVPADASPPSVASAPLATVDPKAAAVRPGLLLAIVLIGQFMAILDVSIVNVAAATIRTDLDASGAALQLVIAGYTIAYAMLLITGARLGGLLGSRPVFLWGLTAFTAASLACGLAVNTEMLVAFRFIQGAGAALMVPQVISIIQRHFEGADRARALSAYAAVIAGGIVAGQILGGVLVDVDLLGTEWRPVFLVNVPIGLALLVLGHRMLPRGDGGGGRQLDIPGLVTLSAAVVALVVPLVLGHELDWPAWGWVVLGLSAVLLATFVVVERRIAQRGGSPLMPAAVLRAPHMAVGAVAVFVAMSTYGGFLFSMALHLQSGLGDSPLRAGFTFVPTAVGFATGSLTWQRLPERWHRPMIPLGFAVAVVGYAVPALVLSDGDHGGLALPLAFMVSGLGFGYAYSPILTVVLRHVAPVHAPDASGLLTTMVQLGQVVGVATFGTLFLSLVDEAEVHPTADAIAATSVALAITVGAASLLGVVLARGHDRRSVPASQR